MIVVAEPTAVVASVNFSVAPDGKSAPLPTHPLVIPEAAKLDDANCFLPAAKLGLVVQADPSNLSTTVIWLYPPIDKHSAEEPKPLF